MWLKELSETALCGGDGPATEEEQGEPPRKKQKSRKELATQAEQRRAALAKLTTDMFVEVDQRGAGPRRAAAGASADRKFQAALGNNVAPMEQRWIAAGHKEAFKLFHTGSKKPLYITECVIAAHPCTRLCCVAVRVTIVARCFSCKKRAPFDPIHATVQVQQVQGPPSG